MSDFLRRLAARNTAPPANRVAEIRPRARSRFEPLSPATGVGASFDTPDIEWIEPTTAWQEERPRRQRTQSRSSGDDMAGRTEAPTPHESLDDAGQPQRIEHAAPPISPLQRELSRSNTRGAQPEDTILRDDTTTPHDDSRTSAASRSDAAQPGPEPKPARSPIETARPAISSLNADNRDEQAGRPAPQSTPIREALVDRHDAPRESTTSPAPHNSIVRPEPRSVREDPLSPLTAPAPRWPANLPSAPAAAAAPSIQVTIGRVEIRAVPPAAPPSPGPARRAAIELDEYLRQRDGRRRESGGRS